MAIDGYKKYTWKTFHESLNIYGEFKRILYKNDDGGALFRQGRTFSFDYQEFLERYKIEPFEGIFLEINNKKGCNYTGYYFLTLEQLKKHSYKRLLSLKDPNSGYKIHIPIQYWNKLELNENRNYVSSSDLDWANRLEREMLTGKLQGLNDSADIQRYHEELADGKYNKKVA